MLDRADLGWAAPGRDDADDAAGGLRERTDDRIERGGEQHDAVADERHAAVVVDRGGAGQPIVVGLPVEQVAVRGPAEHAVEARLEQLERAAGRDPEQARVLVVVVREPLAGAAQQRPVGLVGDRRDVPGRLGQAPRLAAVDADEVHAGADAAIGVGIEVGQEGDGRAVG